MEGILQFISRSAVKPKETVTENPIKEDLLNQIKEVKLQMGAVRCCFDLETNFDLIDSYIMEMDSLERRYAYLIKQAKQQGIAAF